MMARIVVLLTAMVLIAATVFAHGVQTGSRRSGVADAPAAAPSPWRWAPASDAKDER
jgi:hypothetical protein